MQAVQRTRTGNLDWARLRAINAPMKAVGVMERPNTELMKMVVDMYPDEELVRRYADRLTEKRQYVINAGGEQYQEYEQKDLSAFAPEGYNGTTKIGRAYTKSLFPCLPSKILNTIYKESHMELDMSCATSTMLIQAFGEVETEALKRYVDNPTDFYEEMDMPKWKAKRIINSIICSAPNTSENPDLGDWAELSRNEAVQQIRRDVEKLADSLKTRYPAFYEMIKAKCLGDGKERHVDGTALSYFAGDMEHSVMRQVIKYLYPDGGNLQNVVWKYDGMLIPMTLLSGRRHEDFVIDLRRHVSEKLGLDVYFNLRTLEPSFGICLGPDERDGDAAENAYQRWKRYFEKKFARVENPPVYMMFMKGGKMWMDLNESQFKHNTMEQPKAFLKQWLEDPDKRLYHGREFAPPPVELDEHYYNLYRGIAAAELPENEGEVDISRYLNHVYLLCGKVQENADYLHKLIAQKFQKPGLKWRVMPIIISAQGVGKDIWFDFLWELFGKAICTKDDGIHSFADSNSHVLEGKLLVCLQEMGYKDTKDHEEALKAMITNETFTIKKKYFNSYAIRNTWDLIGFTNQVSAVNVSADDRRYFIVESDSTYAQDKDYMLPLLAFFHDDVNKRAVYDYYMGIDIEGFDSSADRPVTEAHKEMVENSLSFGDRFLKMALPIWLQRWRTQDRSGAPGGWDFNVIGNETLRIKFGIIIEDFMEFAASAKINNAASRPGMTQFLSRQIRELNLRTDKYKTADHEKLVMKKKSNSQSFYYIDHRGLKAYLEKVFNEELGEGETATTAAAAPRKTLHHAGPGEPTRYIIKENGETVFGTDDLEEANKELGEAYVVTRYDHDAGEHVQVLIHQHRNNMEIPLGREYIGEGGKARLEAKYPFYVRDRTA